MIKDDVKGLALWLLVLVPLIAIWWLLDSGGSSSPQPYHATLVLGLTARCEDGWPSHSQTHQGTCSSHGGVAQWVDAPDHWVCRHGYVLSAHHVCRPTKN